MLLPDLCPLSGEGGLKARLGCFWRYNPPVAQQPQALQRDTNVARIVLTLLLTAQNVNPIALPAIKTKHLSCI